MMQFFFVPYHLVHERIREAVERNKSDFTKHYGKVEVDYDYYLQMSHQGHAWIALAVETDLVGFAAFVINQNATHREIEAENVVFYIEPQSRGRLFAELLKYARGELNRLGVNKITATIKSDILARSLKQNGFEKHYEIWGINCE